MKTIRVGLLTVNDHGVMKNQQLVFQHKDKQCFQLLKQTILEHAPKENLPLLSLIYAL